MNVSQLQEFLKHLILKDNQKSSLGNILQLFSIKVLQRPLLTKKEPPKWDASVINMINQVEFHLPVVHKWSFAHLQKLKTMGNHQIGFKQTETTTFAKLLTNTRIENRKASYSTSLTSEIGLQSGVFIKKRRLQTLQQLWNERKCQQRRKLVHYPKTPKPRVKV